MPNYDEAILRSRRIDFSAPFPVLHQAVRIALYDEYAARSFYKRVIEAFGPRAPFERIARAEAQHIETLSTLCNRIGIPRPADPYPQETTISASWRANCERGIIGEIENISLYDSLLRHVAEPRTRRVFLNLQAASRNNHLPAFRRAALDALALENYHATHGIPPQQAYVRHGPLSDFMERVFAQASSNVGPLSIFSPFLRQTPPALLAGVAAGSGGVYLLKKRLGRRSGKTLKEN